MRPSLDNLATAFSQNQQQRRVPNWLSNQQDTAWNQVQSLGLPYRKDEHWKYTSLYDLAKIPLTLIAADSAEVASDNAIYTPEQATILHIVNGTLQNEQAVQLPDGVSLLTADQSADVSKTLSSKVARASVIQDLNHAFANAPIVITIKKGVQLTKPLYVLQTLHGDQSLSSPRVHIHVEQDCEATIVEHLVSNGTDNVCNRRLSINVGDNARVKHYTLQAADTGASNLAQVNVNVGRDGQYNSVYIDLGSKLARHDLGIELDGEGAHCSMHGVFLPHSGQHVDHHTLVKHNVAHTTSQQIYHGVAGHKGHGVFNGKVLVQPQAQKINAEQSNKNILLSEHANIDTKPELEIYADDVKCSHGATVGQLDETSLFYLQSRGIDAYEARLMLVRGFVRETYRSLDCPILVEAITANVEHTLNAMLEKRA